MTIQNIPWLTSVILLPLVGSILCFLWPARVKPLGLITAIAVCLVNMTWQVTNFGVQQYAVGGWGAPLGINLYVDDLSLLMLLLTALVGTGISIIPLVIFLKKSQCISGHYRCYCGQY